MEPLPDNPKFPVTIAVHAAGLVLFLASLYLLGLSLTDTLSSLLKFTGAAVLFFGCDELALSGWRFWKRWHLRRQPQTDHP